MPRQLKAFVLAEDLGSMPSTHRQLITTEFPTPGDPGLFSDLGGYQAFTYALFTKKN